MAIETPWDAANVALGVASAAANISQGNYGAAAVDALGVVADLAATATPGVPGGAATGIKAARCIDAIELSIQFGKTENQIYHTFRHTDALGLNRSVVQSAIESHFKTVSSQVVSGKPFNQIIEIAGQRVQYSGFKISDGVFNIGRIHGVK